MKFLVLDDDGNFVSLENTASEARAVAAGQFDQVVDETGGLDGADETRQNPKVKGVYRSGARGGKMSMILSPEDLKAKKGTGAAALRAAGLAQVSEEEVVELTKGFRDWNEVCARLSPILQGTGLGLRLKNGNPNPIDIAHSLLATNYKMSKGKKNAVLCPSCSKPAKKDKKTKRIITAAVDVLMDAAAPPPWTVGKGVKAAKCPKCGVLSRLGTVRGLVLTPYYFGLEAIDRMYEEFGHNPDGSDPQPGQFFGSKEKNAVGLDHIVYPMLEQGGSPGSEFYDKYNASKLQSWRRPVMNAHGTPVRDAKGNIKRAPWDSTATMCLGSSAACRASCLVLTGQQLTNFGAKLAYTKALIEEPAAFYALLTMACQEYFKAGQKEGFKFLRLNVLSDVPHEVTFPALFDLAPGQYYDYTKVSPLTRQADQPDNYDWTFSFNGTNWPQCEKALKAGYRVAVVFAQADPKKGHTPKTRLKKLPETFMGHKVIDGDGDDMRALDEGGVIVALRYKKPKKVEEAFEKAARFTSGFVVPVADVDGWLIAAHTPGQSEANEFRTVDDEKFIHEAVLAQYPEYGLVPEDD